MKKFYHHKENFRLERGGILPELTIAYHTYGRLNKNKSNVIWICHALTASSEASEWWNGLVGNGKAYDTDKYFVICANILGSCYGTTGPTGLDPRTKKIYGIDFPFITIRDMVNAHILLQKHLDINKIHLLAGGSLGGYQVLEWVLQVPSSINNLFLIATSAEESAWGKAIHQAQRMAISSDPAWSNGKIGDGDKGLKAARAIGMLTYRSYELFKSQQSDTDYSLVETNKSSSYVTYQAEKLAKRFDALTYYKLTQSMDSHQVARGRNTSMIPVLKSIQQHTLIMGISTDILCPKEEQIFLTKHIPHAEYHEIESKYGHDGFLIENDQIGSILSKWMEKDHLSQL